jgi:hypothetical protein
MKQSFNIATGEYNLFGESMIIFEIEESGPASLEFPLQYNYLENLLKIQIRKDDNGWNDYEPGQMILAKKLECRLSSPFERFEIELMVMSN